MRFEIGGWDPGNTATENFGNDNSSIPGAVHVKIGKLVRNDTLRMKRAETRFIAEKRAAGHGHAAGKKDFDAGVEPDHRDPGIAEKLGSTGLGIGAAAEREDSWFLLFDGAAKGGAQFIGFELPERRFAMPFKKLRDGDTRGGFDALVEINEPPPELASKTRADGAFT